MDAAVNFWMPITNTITVTVTDTATDTNTKTKTKQYLYQSNRHGRGSRKKRDFGEEASASDDDGLRP